MSKIYSREHNWELSIFPQLPPIETIDEMVEKGYRAELAFNPSTNQHVVSNVLYDKSRYSVEDVMQKVEDLINCERCDTLDKKQLAFESVNVPNPILKAPKHLPPTMIHNQIAASSQDIQSPVEPLSHKVAPQIRDLFGNLVLDTYLTDPGKYFLGLMLDDPTLSESAYPNDPAKIPQFMGDMIDFMSGKQDFMRSPEEAREFLSVMQAQEDAKRVPGRPNVKKRLPGATDTFVIF